MATKTPTKMNVYEIVTDRILTALEKGTVPWHKPWNADTGLPVNLKSKKAYRGINILLLGISAMSAGYKSPYWVSFKQAKDMGGSVKKGESGTVVVFWKPVKEEDSKTGQAYVILRYYRVWNVEQCEGLEGKIPAANDEPVAEFDPIAEAEAILNGWESAPVTSFGGNRACYIPAMDAIRMPEREAFDAPENFYSTHFHEWIHATGHSSRLSRKGVTAPNVRFGDNIYSEEELVAEMGAAFLCGFSGIIDRTVDSSAAYIQGWKKALGADPKLVVKAAAAAQKATDLILGISWDKVEVVEENNDNDSED